MGRCWVAALRGVSSAGQLGVTRNDIWPIKRHHGRFRTSRCPGNNDASPQRPREQHKRAVIKTKTKPHHTSLKARKKFSYDELMSLKISFKIEPQLFHEPNINTWLSVYLYTRFFLYVQLLCSLFSYLSGLCSVRVFTLHDWFFCC